MSLTSPISFVFLRKDAVDAQELSIEQAESFNRFTMQGAKLLGAQNRLDMLPAVDRVIGDLRDFWNILGSWCSKINGLG